MKRVFILLAVATICHAIALGQKKYEMVIEKTDGTETAINVEDIVRTYFRERTEGTGDDSQANNFLVGEWKECDAYGVYRDDAKETEVMHMKFISNDKGEWWSITKGKKDRHWFSFNYTYSLNGSSLVLTQTITASSNSSEVGTSETWQCTYKNGILHAGEIYYKKVGDSNSGESATGGYLTCPDSNHPHAIDLGLPSGTKWACCNVGSSAPEQYGNYYAWGETQPKSVYNVDTYAYYNSNSGYVNIGSDISGTSYDAATANWGAPWSMPSWTQIQELLNNCSLTWTTQNGVEGRRFVGPNGGTIFLPAAGSRWGSDLNNAGSNGNYWSSTRDGSSSSLAYELGFDSYDARWYYDGRLYGHSVRPVR